MGSLAVDKPILEEDVNDSSHKLLENTKEDEGKPTWKDEFRNDPMFFMIVITVAWIEGMDYLSALALSYFFKDDLEASPAELAWATGIMALPWIVKPIWGFITDAFPLFGYRRKSYLIMGGMVGTLGWILMPLAGSIFSAVLIQLLVSTAFAFMNVIGKSLIVQKYSTDQANVSWCLSIYFGVSSMSSVTSAYIGGLLLNFYSKALLMRLTATFPAIITVIALFYVEPKFKTVAGFTHQWNSLKRALNTQIKTKNGDVYYIWMPALFMLVWQSSPSSDTAMFYFFSNGLNFTPEILGRISLVGGVFSLLGVVIYTNYLSNVAFRTILLQGTIIACATTATVLLLVTHENRVLGIPDLAFCLGDSAIVKAVGTVSGFPMLVLAARMCPAGVEGTLYALLLSVMNLSGIISTELGSIMTSVLGITATDFTNLWILVLLCVVGRLLPLPLLWIWVPDDVASIETEDGDIIANTDTADDGEGIYYDVPDDAKKEGVMSS